jgi:hypothetical protein
MEINEIKKVIFKKGDILVMQYPNVLSVQTKINIEKSFERVLDKVGLKDAVGILVFEQGLDISAVLTQVRDDCGAKEMKNPGIPINNGLIRRG